MTYKGHVENGVVVLDEAAALPEGLSVEVIPLQPDSKSVAQDRIPTLAEQFKEWTGIVHDLPEDLAENHDHYLYGTPKK